MNLDKKEQSLLDQELSYWGLKEIASFLNSKVGKKLQEILSVDPKEHWPSLEDALAERWRALGPLTLQDIA